MQHARSMTIAIAVLGWVVASSAPALADASAAAPVKGARYEEQSDKFVLSNADVTVWFQGKKPMLRVFPTGNESAGYAYKFTRIVEFNDANGNGRPDGDEVRTFANLEKAAQWRVTRTQTADHASLNLTASLPITVHAPGRVEMDVPQEAFVANVSLAFHVFSAPTTLNASGIPVRVEAGAIKYDLDVASWPWLNADTDRLALVAQVSGNATRLNGVIEERATVKDGGNLLGVLTWLPEATVVKRGVATQAPVKAHFETDLNVTTVTYAFTASGYERLGYDPTIGIASASAPRDVPSAGEVVGALKQAPGPGLALVAGALAASAGASRVARGRARKR